MTQIEYTRIYAEQVCEDQREKYLENTVVYAFNNSSKSFFPFGVAYGINILAIMLR